MISKYFWLYLYPILAGGFYYCNIIPHSVQISCLTMSPLLVLFVFFSSPKNKTNKTERLLLLFSVVLIFAFLNAFLFYDQNFILSYRVMCSYSLCLYYFVLKRINANIVDMENMLKFHFIIYVLCYIYAYISAPNIAFGSRDFLSMYGSMYRILLHNNVYITLYFFVVLSMLSEHTNKYLLCVLFAFIMQICTITRQSIVSMTVLGVIYYLFNTYKNSHSFFRTTFIVLVIIAVCVGIMPFLNEMDVVTAIQDRTYSDIESESDGGSWFARINNIYYFLFEHDYNPLTFLFGSGFPHWDSPFGSLYESLNDRFIWLSDVGYTHDFFVFGFVGMFIIIKLLYNGIKYKYVGRFNYIRYIYIYFLLCNFMSTQISFNMLVIGALLYMSEICHVKNIEYIEIYGKEKN